MRTSRSADGWTNADLQVLLPQILASSEVTITGEKPLSPQKQTAISNAVAKLWFRFVSEHRAEWESLGLTWSSNVLTVKHFYKFDS